jgi:hypothetical protein
MGARRRLVAVACSITLLGSVVGGCSPSSTASPAQSPTQGPTETPPSDLCDTWSTNFADLASADSADIEDWSGGAPPTMDTSNVHSGGKSVKDAGTMDSQHQQIQTAFSVHGLIDRNSCDLSGKALSIEIYAPADTPIDGLSIGLLSGNDQIIVRGNIPLQKGSWYTYQIDLAQYVTLKAWNEDQYPRFPPSMTDDQVLSVLGNVERIIVHSMVFYGRTGGTYLLVDRLGWRPSGGVPTFDSSVDSLRRYAVTAGLPIGVEIDDKSLTDPASWPPVFQEFDTVVEGCSAFEAWPAAEPIGDEFDAASMLAPCGPMDGLAEQANLKHFRYAGTQAPPGWLASKTPTQTMTILENYIRAEVAYYKGKTAIWNLFNEPLRYDAVNATVTGYGLRDRNQTDSNYSPWADSQSDVSLIEAAFRVAHESDPDALLIMNADQVEGPGTAKANAFYDLAARLVHDGTPIGGVGIECHLYIDAQGRIYQNSYDADSVLSFSPDDGLTGLPLVVSRLQSLGLKEIGRAHV